ncbi:kinase-interacting protein 1-like [Heracleum sosnowskyi]|uniref:Kinase-interacting protein 1-like n=1 Tax=Heracleum sosnowskyi TaxID=360622 RepID=A0AAD8M599_9APIA|nr:kinase-interacting protein 1-like [Heracleum sosnowskyi]
MLQRAASNAYSWWWASHIRTKQSRWLEQSMQDMDEKVEYVLKLFQEDGDSFIQKAEMYYNRRPELIEFVEEAYRAYRALAERYDKLSTDLQKANTTIATCLPEQVQYSMDDDDDDDDFISTGPPKTFPQGPLPPNVPKVPDAPKKSQVTDAPKKLQQKTKPTYTQIKPKPAPKSGLTKTEAFEEIDKLQKDILELQTVKEYVKSSYESGIEKYKGIENEITEKQDKVSRLEEEFGIRTLIEDNDARNLMAKAVLKSCQETLAQLQSKQDKSNNEAEAGRQNVEEVRRRLKSLKHEFFPDETDDDERLDQHYYPETLSGEFKSINQDEVGPEGQKLEALRHKIKEEYDDKSITVTEMVQKIDDLVSKVINLESSVSSQTALIERLTTEASALNSHIRHLEDDKATLADDQHILSNRVKDLEDKFEGLNNLNQNVVIYNTNLQAHFNEAHSTLDQLSEKLQSVKPDEEEEQKREASDDKSQGVSAGNSGMISNASRTEETKADTTEQIQKALPVLDQKSEGEKKHDKYDKAEKESPPKSTEKQTNVETSNKDEESEGELNWPQLLLNGLEDKEKFLMKEYTTILRNYKEVKKKLLNQETESDALFQSTLQVRELKSAIAKRDQEIQSLRHKLQENAPEASKSTEREDAHPSPEDKMEDDITTLINQPKPLSPVEEKLRSQIDSILDENLDFWLRFSAAFQKVHQFKDEIRDLQNEISTFQTREAKKSDKKSNTSMSDTCEVNADIKSEVRAVFNHLNDIKAELKVWIQQSESLKEELSRRFSSLCNIQEAIEAALNEGVEEDEITFSSHQAAKFQGEVLNMKQENNKVNEELQTGIDHIFSLQSECECTIKKLDNEFGLTERAALRSSTRPRVPLRSFIFGVKERRKKQSILSYMQTSKKSHT